MLNRRDFCKTIGRYALAGPLLAGSMLWDGCSRCIPHTRKIDLPQKIILQNGSVFTGDRYQRCDLEIQNGVITSLTTQIDVIERQNTTIIDCTDLYISPGWVDLHCHIGTGIGVEPCLLGPQMGVTALVEAGTYGPENFDSCRKEYCADASIPVYHLLNVRKNGIQVNKKIDLTIFAVPEDEFEYSDTGGDKIQYYRRIIPRYTIIEGELIQAGERDNQLFT